MPLGRFLITFDGKVIEERDKTTGAQQVVFKHMDLPLGRIVFTNAGVQSEVFDGKSWQATAKAFAKYFGIEKCKFTTSLKIFEYFPQVHFYHHLIETKRFL